MAVYNIDCTVPANAQDFSPYTNSLETQFTNAGILERTYYKDNVLLIVKFTRSSKVFRFRTNYNCTSRFGSSFNGTNDINDSVDIISNSTYSQRAESSILIVTPDIIALANRQTGNGTAIHTLIIGRLSNNDEFAFGSTNGIVTDYGYGFINMTTVDYNDARMYNAQKFNHIVPVVDSLGNLYKSKIYLMGQNDIVKDYYPVGINALYRNAVFTTAWEVKSPDILVPGGYFPYTRSGNLTNQNFTICITNGNV